MPKGGYKIISLKGKNITASSTKIDGVYEAFESVNGKPVLITDAIINGSKKVPFYATVRESGTTYTFPASLSASHIVQVYVKDDDNVRIVDSQYGVEAPAGDQAEEPSATM